MRAAEMPGSTIAVYTIGTSTTKCLFAAFGISSQRRQQNNYSQSSTKYNTQNDGTPAFSVPSAYEETPLVIFFVPQRLVTLGGLYNLLEFDSQPGYSLSASLCVYATSNETRRRSDQCSADEPPSDS
jgi:hypothetical protein